MSAPHPHRALTGTVAIAVALAMCVASISACASGNAEVDNTTPSANGGANGNRPIERELTDAELWAALRVGGANALTTIETVSASRLRDLIEWALASFELPMREPLAWGVVRSACDRLGAQPNASMFAAAEIAWLTWPIADIDAATLPVYRRRLATALLDAGRYADCLAVCDYRPARHYDPLDDIRAAALERARAAGEADQ